jgi:glycosyltransferase involved in cell wall biosynthesis
MDKSNPKVSIVIPVYNGSNFLRDAIDSALAQTYENIEIVVINDGSSDGGKTEDVAKSYGEQINYYRKNNGGVASALNLGIKKMTGKYFSWLSHDDLYDKKKIESQVNLLSEHEYSDDVIIACNADALYNNGVRKHDKMYPEAFNNYFDIFLAVSAKVGLNGCSLLVPRKALLLAGGFDTNLPVTQDYDLWFRLKDDYRFILDPSNLVVYRHHDLQDSTKKAQLCLTEGDRLRSKMLQKIPDGQFASFLFSGKNQNWLFDNYTAYKSRGYLKTSLMILDLLSRFDGRYISKRLLLLNIEKEISEITRHLHIPREKAPNGQTTRRRIHNIIMNVPDESYSIINASRNQRRLSGYVESIRSDGIIFMLRKIYHKATRFIRR